MFRLMSRTKDRLAPVLRNVTAGLRPRWRTGLSRVLALLAVSLVLVGGPAAAQKGGKPQAPPLPGIILFDVLKKTGTPDWYAEQWGMTPEGTGKTAAFWHRFQKNSSRAVPSSLVYGVDPILHRLWLTIAEVEVEGASSQVREVFACRLDAAGQLQTVQLTALYPHVILMVNQPGVTWSNDGRDSFVSFTGRTFGEGPTGTPLDELIAEDFRNHIFRLNLSGTDIQSAFDSGSDLRLGVEDIESVMATRLGHEDALKYHSWSPSGEQVVYYQRDGLWVADFSGETVLHGETGTRLLVPAAREATVLWPSWSPDGTRIAFNVAGRGSDSGIHTINPDGTGSALILANTSKDYYGVPVWSPDGGHLAFVQSRSQGELIARIPATGGSVKTLANGMEACLPTGWVSVTRSTTP